MCGIWAWLYTKKNEEKRRLVEHGVNLVAARGPEGTRIIDLSGATFGFTRLAINGLTDAGMQPFVTLDVTWMCNGEIYNAASIAAKIGYTSQSASD